MNILLHVLIVEDSDDDTLLLVHELKRSGFDVLFERVDSYKSMKLSLEKQEWDIVLCDYTMPKFDGLSAMKLLQEEKQEVPCILVSGTIGEDIAVDAIKAGADDYIMKDNLSRLAIAVKRELQEYKDRQELKRMEEAIQTLVKSTVIKTGEDAFRNIVSGISEWLDTDFVCLGQITDGGNYKALSMTTNKIFKDDFKDYCTNDIKGTLFETVIRENFYYCPEGEDSLLPESCKECTGIDVEGFFGMNIQDEYGKGIGLLWAASSKELTLPPRAKNILEIITAKAAAVIKRMWAEEQLLLHNVKLETLVKERTARIMELERQRMENEKLVASGRMAATVAHEVNNPLSTIKGGFMLIKDSIPEDNKYYEYVDIIEKELDRIARIVKQMFDLSKPYQGKISKFDLIAVIRDIISMLKELSNRYNVIINFEGHDDTVKVTLSEDYFRQILYNIIKNALEASSEGGKVEIDTKTNNDRLNVIVSDMGEGMSDKVRSKIFEPFFSTKSKFSDSGLGLGLSTTKVIVEAMEGSIDCVSEKGKGTVFTIDLPINLIE